MRAPPTHGLLAGLALLCACTPNFDTHYSTAHLEIETDFSDPLCEGDLQRWEALITELEGQLEVELEPGLRVYLWDEFDWPDGRWCPKWAVGCYSSSLHAVYSVIWAADHELVHTVAEGLGSNQAFFDEGLAGALQSKPTTFGMSDPSSNLGLDTDEVDRVTSAHFVRWLWESEDPRLLRELIQSKGTTDAFEDIYGFSFGEAEERYFAEAPWSYPPFFTWEVPDLPQTGQRQWEEEVIIDCGGSDTYGRPGGVATIRTLTIEERGFYGLWTDADGLTIEQRQREVIEDMGAAQQQLAGEVPANMVVWRPGGTVTIVDLAPAEYELWVTDFDGDLERADVALWWHRGPIPTLPEGEP